MFLCVVVWPSTGMPSIHIHTRPHVYSVAACAKFDLSRTIRQVNIP
jgi:hypothetical protein